MSSYYSSYIKYAHTDVITGTVSEEIIVDDRSVLYIANIILEVRPLKIYKLVYYAACIQNIRAKKEKGNTKTC